MLPLFTRPLAVAAGLLLALATARAAPLSSAFTYQGRIDGNGVPVAGPVDLEFAPFADPAGTQSLGAPVVVEDVAVADGQFTARVDFGPGFFVGDQVFLRIGVRPGAETGSFEALSPLQELTATPYALKPAADSVTDVEIADGAVGASELADGGVGMADLAPDSVGAAQIADAAVGTDQIANGAVGASELADGGVGMADLAPDSVGAAQVADAAVGTDQIADKAVTAAKLDPDAFSGFVLADGSVTNPKLAVGAVNSVSVEDGSVLPADLNLPQFGTTFWQVGGNAGAGASFLGTTDGAPLNLRSNVGVTVNGGRLNNNTEVTVRGSPTTVETNADLTLWPRDGTALFNLSVIGSTPADTVFAVQSVGTNPFTGFTQRLMLNGSGQLGVGGGNPAPLGQLHATGGDIGVDASDLTGTYELILEDTDAMLGLFSTAGGVAGSVLALAELDGNGAFANTWGITRATSQLAGSPLQFGYGTNQSAALNPVRMALYSNGGLFVGAVPSTPMGASFVFADDSAAVAFNGTAPNQFNVRAAGGVGINRAGVAGVELGLGATDGDLNGTVDLHVGTAGSVGQFRIHSSVAGAADDIGRLMIFNTNGTFNNSPIFEFITQPTTRRLGLFRGMLNGSWVSPAHPLHVGFDATSGNGAHLTAGGVWTNGSSRAFKEAFETIDTEAVLERLLELPVTRWRYKGDDPSWHLGPMAEEFRAAFGLGHDPQYIGTVDADGVALAAVQGLNGKLERRAQALADENAALREALAALAARVQALESATAR